MVSVTCWPRFLTRVVGLTAFTLRTGSRNSTLARKIGASSIRPGST